MDGFGDFEAEDAWNADDDPVALVRNLVRRIRVVDQMDPPQTGTIREDLDGVWYRAIAALSDPDLRRIHIARIGMILADVGTVRGRLA